jgi:hypothetical protein
LQGAYRYIGLFILPFTMNSILLRLISQNIPLIIIEAHTAGQCLNYFISIKIIKMQYSVSCFLLLFYIFTLEIAPYYFYVLLVLLKEECIEKKVRKYEIENSLVSQPEPKVKILLL